MTEITVSEAINQGYVHCGVSDGDFQHLISLEDVVKWPDTIENGKEWVVAQKEATYLNIDADSLWELVSDHLMSDNDFADDTDMIPDYLKKDVDWELFAAQINDSAKKRPYWYLTKIKLLPDAKLNQ